MRQFSPRSPLHIVAAWNPRTRPWVFPDLGEFSAALQDRKGISVTAQVISETDLRHRPILGVLALAKNTGRHVVAEKLPALICPQCRGELYLATG